MEGAIKQLMEGLLEFYYTFIEFYRWYLEFIRVRELSGIIVFLLGFPSLSLQLIEIKLS